MNIPNAACVVASAGLAFGAGRAGAQAVWTNGAGTGLWHDAGNWSTSAVPSVGTPVVIPQGFPGVTAQGGIGAATINAMSPVFLGGGVSTLAQGGTFQNLTVSNNSISAGGPVTISGQSSMGGATFTGGQQWKNTGLMLVNPGLGVNTPTKFVNDGTVNVEATLILAGAQAVMTNNGLVRLIGTGRMTSGGLLSNLGELRKTGAGQSIFEPRLNNGGDLAVDAGLLSFQGGCTFLGGQISVGQGATLRLEHPSGGTPHQFNGLASAGGAGDMVVQMFASNPPAMRVTSPVSFSFTGPLGLHLVTGDTQLDATVRNFGRMTWGSHRLEGTAEFINEAGATVDVPPGGTAGLTNGGVLVNKGVVEMRGNLSLTEGGVLKNENGGMIRWDNGDFLASTTGRLENRGTVSRLGGTGTIGVPYEQREGGRTDAIVGVIHLTAGGHWGAGGGVFDISAGGGRLEMSGALPYNVVGGNHLITGGGEARQNVNSAVVVHSGASLTLNVNGAQPDNGYDLRGMIGGGGVVMNSGRVVCRGAIGVSGQADFRNQGLVEIAGGSLNGAFTNNNLVFHKSNWALNGGVATNNAGWLCAPEAPAALLAGPGTFRNVNTFSYFPPVAVGSTVQSPFDNTGRVIVVKGTLQFTGPVAQLQNGALTGGIWEVQPGATLIFPPPLNRITTGAKVIGSRAGQTGVQSLGSVSEISSGGELQANGDTTFNGRLNVINGGRLLVCAPAQVQLPQRLYGGWVMTTPTRIDQSSRGEGPEPRIIAQALENSATVGPGGPGEPGPFNLTGIYAQTMDGELEIEIGGPSPIAEHDRMDVTGPATVAGRLRLALLDGFTPVAGDTFTVLTATGGISGRFTTVQQPASMPAGLEFTVVYGPNSVGVRVGVACYPDCSSDGLLTIADFGCFQSLFVGGHTYADCNSDAALTAADFGCFQTRFIAGCP